METIKGNNTKGKVMAVCVSKTKGNEKHNIKIGILKENFGIIDDAHAGSNRQVSLLAEEAIEKMKAKGLSLNYGDFGENLVIRGIDLKSLAIATKLNVGEDIVLEISEIGKTCVSRCAIYYKTGDCIMPSEGVFARVIKGGIVKVGDRVESHGLASDNQSHRVEVI